MSLNVLLLLSYLSSRVCSLLLPWETSVSVSTLDLSFVKHCFPRLPDPPIYYFAIHSYHNTIVWEIILCVIILMLIIEQTTSRNWLETRISIWMCKMPQMAYSTLDSTKIRVVLHVAWQEGSVSSTVILSRKRKNKVCLFYSRDLNGMRSPTSKIESKCFFFILTNRLWRRGRCWSCWDVVSMQLLGFGWEWKQLQVSQE